MTEQELAAIEQRASAATSGKWSVAPLKGKYYGTAITIGGCEAFTLWRIGGYDDPQERIPSQAECPGWTPDWRDEYGDVYYTADNHYQSQRDYDNAQFIAHARTDVPALVAAVRERDVEIARLKALVREAYEEGVADAGGEYQMDHYWWAESDARKALEGA